MVERYSDQGGLTRRGAIGILAGGALVGCGLIGQRASFRVRMKVFVQTPRAMRTGSAVMEMLAVSRISAGTQSESRYSAGLARAEAVAVDLADGPIFALLILPDGGGDLADPILRALDGYGRLSNDDIMTFVRKMGEPGVRHTADIRRYQWPLMVRFGDINDPRTIEQVDPQAIGVKRVTLETTTDPVTTGIDRQLKWLPHVYDILRGVNFAPSGIPVGDFKRLFSTEIR